MKRKILFGFFIILGFFLISVNLVQAEDNYCCESSFQGYGTGGEPTTVYECKNNVRDCDNKGWEVVLGNCEKIDEIIGVEMGWRCMSLEVYQEGGFEDGTLNTNKEVDPIYFKTNIAIPGLEEFSQGQGVKVDGAAIAKYIGGLYKFFIGIAGILAVIMIAFGGIQWLFSGGSSDKISGAKETIVGAVMGLLLALGSYLILYVINPDLVNLKPLEIPEIEYDVTIAGCPSEGLVESLQTLADSSNGKLILGQGDFRLLPSRIEYLSNAIDALESDERLEIRSAYRINAMQDFVYRCYKNRVGDVCPNGCSTCNLAAAPNCDAPHQSGKAVDICLRTSSGTNCGYLSQECNDGFCNNSPDLRPFHDRLKQIMTEAGFSSINSEWWHFQ